MKSNGIPAAGAEIGCLPNEVSQAMAYDWGVFVDAYLVDAARVGDCFAATVFCDQSGVSPNGATVATRALRQVAAQGAFKLLQTLDGGDHYVLESEHKTTGSTHCKNG